MQKTFILFLLLFVLTSAVASAFTNYTYSENFGAGNYNASFWTFIDGNTAGIWENGTNSGLVYTNTGTNFPFLRGRAIPTPEDNSHPTYITFKANWGLNHTPNVSEYYGVGVMTSGLTMGSWSPVATPPTVCGIWIMHDNGRIGLYAHDFGLPYKLLDIAAVDNSIHTIEITFSTPSAGAKAFGVIYDGANAGAASFVGGCGAATYSPYVFSRASSVGGWARFNVYEYEEQARDSNTTSSNVTMYEVGKPCNNNADCASGICENRKCQCLQGGVATTDFLQCCSRELLNNICTAPSLSQTLNAGKEDLIGEDQASSDFVSLLLALIPAFLLASWGFGSGNFTIGGALALGWVFVSVTGLVIIGWMSPIFLIGMFMVALVVAAILIVIGAKS